MKISELKTGQGDVDVEAEVVGVEEPRSFNKFGRQLRVANAKIKDDSGEITLTLWNDDIDKVKPGSKIKLTKGYVKEFNNEKQLTTGKFGSFEIVEGGGGEETPTEPSPQEELPAPSEEAMPEESKQAEQTEEVSDEDLL